MDEICSYCNQKWENGDALMSSDGQMICPKCKLNLKSKNNNYFCSQCKKIYPISNGIISFINENTNREGYKEDYFLYLEEVERKHFWFQARKNLILYFIKKYCKEIINGQHKMLEIGCGNGNVLYYLRNNGINCQGGDLFLESLMNCRKKGKVSLFQIDALHLPFRNYFDIIGLFDVMEHIEKDKEVLKEVSKSLKSNGKLIITAPAHKKLWGRYDEVSFHKRRYSEKELIAQLEISGFTVEKTTHFVSLLFPILLLFRYFNQKSYSHISDEEYLKREIQVIPFLNTLFLWILAFERILIHFIHFPFGSSLIAIARKIPNES